MKNEAILARVAVSAGIITEEEVKLLLDTGKEIPLHTLQGWKLRGNYRVKDGEEPIDAKIWKKKEDGSFCLVKVKLYSEKQMICKV